MRRPKQLVSAVCSLLLVTLISPIQSAQAANPTFTTAGLMLRYDVNNPSSYSGSGTAINDLTSNAINATESGTTLPSYTAANGGYISFNGAQSQYAYTDTITTSGFNMNLGYAAFMWVRPTGNGIILDERGQEKGAGGWQDSVIEVSGNQLKVGGWNGSVVTASPALPSGLNQWVYVGFSYTPTTVTSYLNGVAYGSFTRSTANLPVAPAYNKKLFYSIGQADATNLGNGSYGNFDFGSLHVYDSALTTQQILDNYNATKARFLTPTITSFTPTSGGPGTTVTLTGTNIYGTTAVNFNGVAASSFNVVSDTQTTAVVPNGNATGRISFISGGNTATSATDYTAYIGMATISLSLQGGGSTANKSKSSTINATLNTSGTVTFYANGRPINRCKSIVTATTSASCSWLPLTISKTSLTAYVNPTTSAYTAALSSPFYVQVLKRIGPR